MGDPTEEEALEQEKEVPDETTEEAWIREQDAEIEPGVARLNDVLEQKLRSDASRGRLHPDARPRHLANVAWLTAHGLVSLLSGLERHGVETRIAVDELVAEACATLRRASEVEPGTRARA